MVEPAVSVVIPTYNRAPVLERMLTALDGQTGLQDHVEVIVVDDGSADETAEVVAAHPEVVYVRQANAGPAAARNRGWSRARGRVVAFTDDDTVPDGRWLADLAEAFAADPGLDAAGGTVRPLRVSFLTKFAQAEAHASHGVKADGEIKYLVTANCAYRREVLAALGGFDETFPAASGEDTDLTMRAQAAGYRMGLIDGAVVLHDHPTRLVPILKTYLKHGRTWPLVMSRNPSNRPKEARADVLTVANWRQRYDTYRRNGIGPAGAFVALGLRAMGLFAFYVGMSQARSSASSVARRARTGSDASSSR